MAILFTNATYYTKIKSEGEKMAQWICSNCRAPAMNDSRDGGPVLLCGCDRGQWIDDGRGGYEDNPTGAHPIMGEPRRQSVQQVEVKVVHVTVHEYQPKSKRNKKRRRNKNK